LELYVHTSNTPSWGDAELKEAQEQLYFYLKKLNNVKFNSDANINM